jgi:hypothetical protein
MVEEYPNRPHADDDWDRFDVSSEWSAAGQDEHTPRLN